MSPPPAAAAASRPAQPGILVPRRDRVPAIADLREPVRYQAPQSTVICRGCGGMLGDEALDTIAG